ncbi:hypothetical protein D3C80_1411040 [compost metagenome]
MGIGNFIGSHQPGAGGAKGVAPLALVPGAAAFDLEFTLRDVVDHAVAGNVLHRVLLADIAPTLTNDHPQLHLPVGLERVTRDLHLIVRPDHRAGPLVEHHWFRGDRRAGFRRMVSVIETNTDKLADVAHARPQTRLSSHLRQLVDVQRAQLVQRGGQQCFTTQIGDVLREVTDLTLIVQYPRTFLPRCAIT